MKEPCKDCGTLKKVGRNWEDGLCGKCRSAQNRLSKTPRRKKSASGPLIPESAAADHAARIEKYTQRAALRLPLFAPITIEELELAVDRAREIADEEAAAG